MLARTSIIAQTIAVQGNKKSFAAVMLASYAGVRPVVAIVDDFLILTGHSIPLSAILLRTGFIPFRPDDRNSRSIGTLVYAAIPRPPAPRRGTRAACCFSPGQRRVVAQPADPARVSR
jgi:hypothetical protein